MERRLYFGILLPSSILTLVLGILLSSLAWEGYVTKVWYWVKVTLVLVLFGYQGLCSRFRRQFAKKQNSRPPTFYRWFNEVPTVVLLVILILVVIKPI